MRVITTGVFCRFSFDPASVLCFLTVFSPFTMAALIMWKVDNVLSPHVIYLSPLLGVLLILHISRTT